MKGKQIISAILFGVAVYASYKVCKKLADEEKEKTEKFEARKQEVIAELDATCHKAAEWNNDYKDLTLNNEKLKPTDRAYAYEMFNEKFRKVLKAKTEKELDESRKEFEEFLDILISVKDPETLETLIKIDQEKKAALLKVKAEREARQSEYDKYKLLASVVEKVGSNIVCGLAQQG